MRNLMLLLGGTFLMTSAFASSLTVCDVTAKVIAVEELSIFSKGSNSLYSWTKGIEEYSIKEYSFVNLLTLKVLEAEAQPGTAPNCQGLKKRDQKVILSSEFDLKKITLGATLKLVRITTSSQLLGGLTNSERWEYAEEE